MDNSMANNVAIVRTQVPASVIPDGFEMVLEPGQEVLVTQEKGGSFTLNVNGNLVYLEGKYAEAIGRSRQALPVDQTTILPGDPIDIDLLWAQLKTVYDPEIPVNIVDLGLIYEVDYTALDNGNYHISVQMTLTAPGCGMGPVLVQDVENKLEMVPNVDKADALIVFEPPWNANMMSEEAKLELGLF